MSQHDNDEAKCAAVENQAAHGVFTDTGEDERELQADQHEDQAVHGERQGTPETICL